MKDPFQDIREGYNEEKCVSVWTPGGRKKVLATVSDKNSWDTLTKRCFFPSRAPLVPLKVVYRGLVTKSCTPTLRG